MDLVNSGGDVTDRDRAERERPRLRDLLGVLAIAKTVSRGNVSFTLFSLEAYAEGFAVEGRRLLEEGHPVLADVRRRWEEWRRNDAEVVQSEPGAMADAARAANLRTLADQPIATMDPTATDDRGTRYRSWLVSGSGMAEESRFSYAFTPPLDPAARELRVEIPALRWLVREPDGDRRIDGGAEPGPWPFSLPLTRS